MMSFIKTIVAIICLYILQFLLMPFLFSPYFPISNEAYIIFVVTAMIFLSFGFCVVNNRITHWLIADIIYSLFIILCNTNCMYGIGMSRISIDGLQTFYSQKYVVVGSIIATVVIIIIQLIINGINFVFKKARDTSRQHD